MVVPERGMLRIPMTFRTSPLTYCHSGPSESLALRAQYSGGRADEVVLNVLVGRRQAHDLPAGSLDQLPCISLRVDRPHERPGGIEVFEGLGRSRSRRVWALLDPFGDLLG